MHATNDLHVVGTRPLPSPNELKAELPQTPEAAHLVVRSRTAIREIIVGADRRPLVIVGPCSVHDPQAALDYAERLVGLKRRYEEELVVVMRVYFEKPRTTVGWKGLINDPHLNGSHDIAEGLRTARRLLLDVARMGIAAATEMLDPIVPQYLGDLVSWTAIGARTTESQTHREMASGLSMPVGYKNGTDGSLQVAINALLAASQAHSFLGIDDNGRVAIVRTTGNPDGHIVLRGGSSGPNYSAAQVAAAGKALAKAGTKPRLLVDCSHDNSGKNFRNQPAVVDDLAAQIAHGSPHLLGVMIESNIHEGRQDLHAGMAPADLAYGVSITDGCIDFPTTERALGTLARAARSQRSVAVARRDDDSGAQLIA